VVSGLWAVLVVGNRRNPQSANPNPKLPRKSKSEIAAQTQIRNCRANPNPKLPRKPKSEITQLRLSLKEGSRYPERFI